MADGQVVFQVTADNSKLSSELDSSTSVINKKTSGWAGAAKGAAVAIGASFTALAAVGKQVYDFGSEYEQTIKNASTLFGDTNVDIDNLNDKMLSLSDSTGIAADEIGTALYGALSAGIPATEDMSEAMSFLENSAKLAKGGLTDIASASGVTSSVLNAYKLGVEDVDKVQKMLIQTQNKGVTTVDQLAASLGDVLPSASAANVGFDQVSASLATMTATMGEGSTPKAVTSLKALLAELSNTGSKTSKGLEEATKAAFGTSKTFGQLQAEGYTVSDVMQLMADHAENSGKSMYDFVGSQEAVQAALLLTGDNAETFNANLEAMSTEVDVVGEAAEEVGSSTAEQMNKMINSIKVMAIELFGEIQPMIAELLPLLSDAIKQVLPPLIQLIVDIMPQVIALFTQLMPIIVELITSLLPPLIDVFMALLPPIMDLIQVLLPPLASLLKALAPLLVMIAELLSPIIELFGSLLGPIIEVITSALTPLIEIISEIIDAVFPLLEGALKSLSETFGSIFKTIGDTVKGAFDGIKQVFSGVIDFITGVFTGNWKKAWEGVRSIFKGIIDTLVAIFKAPLNWIIDGINVFIRGLNKIKIPDWVPLVGGKGFNIGEIPRLAKGGTLTSDGSVMVGEKGPEILDLPRGARVTPLTGTYSDLRMAGNAGMTIDYDALAAAIWKKAPNMNRPIVLNGRVVSQEVSKGQQEMSTIYQRSGYRG
ncbi:MAG TPA: phage tail tape measure protein [Bacillota bacterium]|nr:phage tail tape measure protein [Bacillota bacterium]